MNSSDSVLLDQNSNNALHKRVTFKSPIASAISITPNLSFANTESTSDDAPTPPIVNAQTPRKKNLSTGTRRRLILSDLQPPCNDDIDTCLEVEQYLAIADAQIEKSWNSVVELHRTIDSQIASYTGALKMYLEIDESAARLDGIEDKCAEVVSKVGAVTHSVLQAAKGLKKQEKIVQSTEQFLNDLGQESEASVDYLDHTADVLENILPATIDAENRCSQV